MKFTASTKPFLAAFGPVARVVPNRTTIPILSHVLIEAAGAEAVLVANDLDREAEVKTPVGAAENGAFALPASILLDILKKLPADAEFTLEVHPDANNGRATLRSGRSRFVLPVLPAGDFPRLGASEFSHTFTLPAPALHRALTASFWAVSTEETRYYLNGVFWHFTAERLNFVATDGYRLARFAREAPKGAHGAPSIIVPSGAVKEILRRAADAGEADATIAVSDRLLKFTIPGSSPGTDATLTTKLIDGTFPDYARLIPESFVREARLDRETFRRAIDLASPILSERGAAMRFDFGDGKVLVVSRSPDAGEATTECETEFDGEDISIGFNARYALDALDALAAFDGEGVKIAMNDAGSPARLTDPLHPDLTVILMPCRA